MIEIKSNVSWLTGPILPPSSLGGRKFEGTYEFERTYVKIYVSQGYFFVSSGRLSFYIQEAYKVHPIPGYSWKIFWSESFPVWLCRSAVTGLCQNKQPCLFRGPHRPTSPAHQCLPAHCLLWRVTICFWISINSN